MIIGNLDYNDYSTHILIIWGSSENGTLNAILSKYFLQNKQRVTALFSLSGFGTNEAEETMLKNLGVNVNSVYVLYHLLDKFLITNFLNIIKQ